MANRFMQPDVLALGSSRIMQVKENVINNRFSFYNAGGAIMNIYQYKMFMDRLHFSPKLVIINIDQWLFNPYYADQRTTLDKKCYQFPRRNFTFQCLSLITDTYKGKIDFVKLFDTDNNDIGLSAKINRNGFSHDGSYYYGQLRANPSSSDDYNFVDTFRRIEEGNRNFQYCSAADTTIIEAMDSFLTDCVRRKVAVLAILPPFAPIVYKKMEESGKYHYMNQIIALLSACFEKYPHCFIYDYTDVASMNAQNYDFIDGFHGSEIIYNIILKDIVGKNKELEKYFASTNAIDSINSQYNSKHIRFHNQ